MKILPFENMLNMRDCCGYKSKHGGQIKEHMLIRSDAPKEMSDEEINYLLDNGINTEIDLRTNEVIAEHPSTLANIEGINYLHFPIAFGSQKSLTFYEVKDLYRLIIGSHNDLEKVFRAILNAPQGIIVNCTAGKDRTGIIVFVLLKLCGVSNEDIIEDYVISAPLINSKIEKYRETHPSFPATLGVSNRDDIEDFVKYFDETYHSAEEYLKILGFTDNEIETLRNKFLEK